MRNKYVVTRKEAVKYTRENLDTLVANALSLSRYAEDHPDYEKARQNYIAGFEYIMTNPEVENDNNCLLTIHSILMEDLEEGIKNSLTEEQCTELAKMLNQPAKANVEIALDTMLYILDKRLFADGDVRVAIMFSNKIMLENGCGIITIAPKYASTFREMYQQYQDTHSDDFKNWLYKCCIRGPKVEY